MIWAMPVQFEVLCSVLCVIDCCSNFWHGDYLQYKESDSSIKKQEQFTIYRPKIPNIKSQNNENLTNIGDKPLVKNCYSRTAVPGINTCLVLL